MKLLCELEPNETVERTINPLAVADAVINLIAGLQCRYFGDEVSIYPEYIQSCADQFCEMVDLLKVHSDYLQKKMERKNGM